MKTYMDKEVFIDFHINEPDRTEEEKKIVNWFSLKKFLRLQSDLILNVNLDKEDNGPLSMFVSIIKTYGYAGKVICDASKFRFKNKIDFQKEFQNPDNLFFINEINEGELDKWKNRNGYYVASSKELLEAWKKISLSDSFPKSLPVRDFEVPYNLTSWEGIAPYQHPVTDVIISDRFFLKEKDLVEANFIPLLKCLIANKTAHFNLTLFTSIKEVFERDIEKMKVYLQGLISTEKYNCTLVLVYDTIERFKEHDRHIITNYYHISSGDTFTFFTKSGKLKTNGTTIDIKPLVDKDYFLAACAVLKNIKRSYEHFNIKKTNGGTNRLFSLAEV